MSLAVAATVFPVIALGELPDKTMFASLLLATRGRPGAVWLGAAAAFAVHVVIAVSVGGFLLTLLPGRVVDAVVALLFGAGAVFAWRDTPEAESDAGERAAEAPGHGRTVATAFAAIFLAEWGDLTQVLTANLAAAYRDPVSVGVGAIVALWGVGGLAVLLSRPLRRVPVAMLRRITAVALVILAAVAAAEAATGRSLLP